MVRQNQRAHELFRARQRGLQKNQLRVPQFLGRNGAGVLEHIGIESDDPHQWRLEREEHAGLDLRGARETAGLEPNLELSRTEIVEERSERDGVRARRDHARRDCQRWPGLAPHTRDTAHKTGRINTAPRQNCRSRRQVEEKARDILVRFFVKIGDHLVSDLGDVIRTTHRPRVAHRMENELA
jgi:hypothetical protein